MTFFQSLTPYLSLRGERLRAVVDGAVAFAERRQALDGSWVVSPEPRILENALVLYCLSRAGIDLPGVDAARAWLRGHRPSPLGSGAGGHSVAQIIEAWLWHMASGETPEPLDLRHPDFARPVYARRWRLLAALATEAGLADAATAERVRASVRGTLRNSAAAKPWSAAEDAALYIVLHPDDEAGERATALAIIASAQAANGSIADNPISTVLALWAQTRTGQAHARARSARYLADARVDGTWRVCTTEIWDTALLARSLSVAGLGPALVRGAQAYLASQQNGDGGWSYAPGRSSDVDTTAMVLSVLDKSDSVRLLAARAYLLGRRDANGLWPTWNDKDDSIADDVVAHAVVALEHAGAPVEESARALKWLARRIEDGVGWRADWYDNQYYAAYEIGMAVRRQHPHTRRIAADLMAQQNSDGGFAPAPGRPSTSDATGCALALLGEFVGADHPAFLGAVDYLLATVDERGSWAGPTGMFGPRPFVSDYAMQTHALALLGVGYVVRKLTGGHRERRREQRAVSSYLEPHLVAQASPPVAPSVGLLR